MSLIEVRSHTLNIPQRLREINQALRVYFNTARQQYEVYANDIAHKPYLLTQCSSLDERLLNIIKAAYTVAENTGAPYQYYLKQQEVLHYMAERKRQNDLTDLGKNIKKDMAGLGKVAVQGATIPTDHGGAG